MKTRSDVPDPCPDPCIDPRPAHVRSNLPRAQIADTPPDEAAFSRFMHHFAWGPTQKMFDQYFPTKEGAL